MRVSLHFDNADGFGEWRILIGTNAIRKLKEFRRSDAQKFKTVYKKIKELSYGKFSDENQKRLDGALSGVPIFEANVPPDLMLVYQVDCVPAHASEVEQQVIKIYGMYTRTHLNGVWDAISHHLSGTGEEHIERCIFRNKPIYPGSKVYLPAVFPLAVHKIVAEPPSLVLDDQEMNDLHSLLVLNKYVTFSQALLSGSRTIVLCDDPAKMMMMIQD